MLCSSLIRRRSGWPALWAILAGLILAAGLGGCAAKKPAAPAAASDTGDQNAAAALIPHASIHVSYAHPRDYLKSLLVTKYSGANILLTSPGKQGSAAIVRFEGGITIWGINVDKSVLANLPLLDFQREYARKKISYGMMPKHFMQSIPENGPPEPLEPDHYYIFEVSRGIGPPEWEAVKIGTDGSLTSYAAEPRAGTSYRLCCNVSADFTVTAGTSSSNDSDAAIPDEAPGPPSEAP
ncbi:MAG: hypothetical protein ACRD4Q_05700 [Candidatus Acidiferrales bacterium]